MEREQININGILDEWGYARSNVAYLLNKHKGPVLCVVNSYGGSVNEGLAISRLFERHGDVVVRFVGCVASAATWMAFGAKSIEIAADALWLAHQCSNLISIYKSMKIEDIEKTIKDLESTKKSQEAVNLTIAKKYADRCGKRKNLHDVMQLMEEERWMTADEAYEWGFVDKVIPGLNKMTDETKDVIMSNCAAMNLPTPHWAKQEESGLLTRIADLVKVDLIKSVLTGQNHIPQTGEKNLNPNKTKTKEMNKLVNLALIIGDIAVAAEGATISEESLGRIEHALDEANKNKKALDEVLEALNSVSENIKAIEGGKNKVLAVKAVLNGIPSVAPAGNVIPQTSDDKAGRLKNVAKDPVNAEMQSIYGRGKK